MNDAVDPDDVKELRSRLAVVVDRIRHPNLLSPFLSREAVYNNDTLIDIEDDGSQIPLAELGTGPAPTCRSVRAAEDIIDDLQIVKVCGDSRRQHQIHHPTDPQHRS